MKRNFALNMFKFAKNHKNKQKLTMKLAIGSDHAGYAYKTELIDFLSTQKYLIKDFGTDSENSADYADFAHQVATSVENQESDFGILLCGSGNGICMTANKHQKIRAALCWNVEVASLARQHNNANIICIPARFVSLIDAKAMIRAFLETNFEGGRHLNRINKIPNASINLL
jgi:ribose 5-phosphate isomerase B